MIHNEICQSLVARVSSNASVIRFFGKDDAEFSFILLYLQKNG